MDYPVESFTAEERAILAPYFSNLDRPVFALLKLPETVKGALFARYSRYPGTLRRLFLEEFAADLSAPDADAGTSGVAGTSGAAASATPEPSARAADLYDRIFLGYGDDSVAQLGGAHVATEWVSNVLTKVLQRPRLGAYLEQSTRYIAYDQPMEGSDRFRYYRDPELGPQYAATLDGLFAAYSEMLPRVMAWAAEMFPRAAQEPEAAHTRAIRAKALDLLRGLLPAATLSHMGIFASGQSYEQLILHLLAHPLPEARTVGEAMLAELKHVIPSFLTRVERPERGGEWIAYLENRRAAGERWAARLAMPAGAEPGPSVRLLHVDGDEEALLCALLFEHAGSSEDELRASVAGLDATQRAAMLGDLVGTRANRRHRPGRGFEALRYRFEIVADYGAFRDLQRHRMLTVQWQALTPDLGAGVPEQLEAAGVADRYRGELERSAAEYGRLVEAGHVRAAPYALCLGYRIRFILDLNAREAMQLIELRSGREGHPSYRAVAHEMHRQISHVHPGVAAAMSHVDSDTEPRLERILAEMREAARR
ncbi:MAG TPA: FAD-dependent thymidylate synthase [Solirubrobacteraceae bacterium]|nr:FAD-dependent thymidylate synthase [Solirubrobacteraceae bacterium]